MVFILLLFGFLFFMWLWLNRFCKGEEKTHRPYIELEDKETNKVQLTKGKAPASERQKSGRRVMSYSQKGVSKSSSSSSSIINNSYMYDYVSDCGSSSSSSDSSSCGGSDGGSCGCD